MPLCGQRKNRRFSKETPKTKRVRVTPLDRNRAKTVTRVTPGCISVFEPPLSETPSTKPQAPEKFQISNTKPQKQMPGQTARRSVFELGTWCFFGAWSLEFGACCLGSQFIDNSDAPFAPPRLTFSFSRWMFALILSPMSLLPFDHLPEHSPR